MISAGSALSGFDFPALGSKNLKDVLRVFLRVSASPRQEASLKQHAFPGSFVPYNHSYRSATMGSIFVARLAGM